MSAPVAPLLTAWRDGRRLRAFPAAGEAPALPWLSVLDLGEAALAERTERVDLMASIREGWLRHHVHGLATHDGSVLAIEHAAAFLLLVVLGSAPEADRLRIDDARALLEDAIMAASLASVAGLPAATAKSWADAAYARDRRAYAAVRARLSPEERP